MNKILFLQKKFEIFFCDDKKLEKRVILVKIKIGYNVMAIIEDIKKEFKEYPALFIYLTILILLVIISIFIGCNFPKSIAKYLFGDKDDATGELVTRIILPIGGGLVAIAVAYSHYQRVKAMEKQNKNQAEQIKLLANQIKVTEKGQVDERFKNAIDQLGNEKEAVVLGAIHSLHNLAIDSPRYRKTVFDILCSYIRQRSKEVSKEMKEYHQMKEEYKNKIHYKDTKYYLQVQNQFQTIIDLLFVVGKETYDELRADLSMAYLYDVKLYNADLRGADLRGADLNMAKLGRADLRGADLSFADLREVNLSFADLRGANLSFADLNFADLKHAILREVVLSFADLSFADLSFADLSFADLRGANLIEADFNTFSFLRLKETIEYRFAFGLEAVNINEEPITVLENEEVKAMLEEWNKPEWKAERGKILKGR